MTRLRATALTGAAVVALVAGASTSSAVATPEQPTTVRIGGGSGIVFGKGKPVPARGATWCTMTTIGHDKAGDLVGLTNAHCFYGDDNKPVLGDKIYYNKTPAGTAAQPAKTSETDLETGVIGEVVHVSLSNPVGSPANPGLDYSVIRFDRAKVVPTATVGGLTIDGIGTPPTPGTRMCKQGQTTGLTCGFMVSTSGPYFGHTIWEGPGDSGSPVVLNNKLIGNQWAAGLSTSMTAILADMNKRGEAGAGFTPVAP
ncbi:S1 family peptidase [Allokutzneria sp. A3M-2-11 16]|uniref:trypsin-like serine protease n=1 Tax=Allokutzneria sp. A3M-2-11 16 TaxID=2962043 RepID=UPI0020B87BE9|nr:trypsin-like peptidase domain-containing protein [Allokutzneria sp. A3M-2-11 16]MCP3803071.1 S1 family peptidase [Allokutzneria sp. A3M-2-11 16]